MVAVVVGCFLAEISFAGSRLPLFTKRDFHGAWDFLSVGGEPLSWRAQLAQRGFPELGMSTLDPHSYSVRDFWLLRNFLYRRRILLIGGATGGRQIERLNDAGLVEPGTKAVFTNPISEMMFSGRVLQGFGAVRVSSLDRHATDHELSHAIDFLRSPEAYQYLSAYQSEDDEFSLLLEARTAWRLVYSRVFHGWLRPIVLPRVRYGEAGVEEELGNVFHRTQVSFRNREVALYQLQKLEWENAKPNRLGRVGGVRLHPIVPRGFFDHQGHQSAPRIGWWLRPYVRWAAFWSRWLP